MTTPSDKRHDSGLRAGEIRSPLDPAIGSGDGHVVFIGHIRSPWKSRAQCPKNMRQARERSPEDCCLVIDETWRAGLTGLAAGSHIHILYWMHHARRDIVLQMPGHRDTPAGVFSLRSPVRPNPIAMALVRIVSIDMETGIVAIDATDALDGTPLIDLKPYLPGVDNPPDD